jgi:hypothetical protein
VVKGIHRGCAALEVGRDPARGLPPRDSVCFFQVFLAVQGIIVHFHTGVGQHESSPVGEGQRVDLQEGAIQRQEGIHYALEHLGDTH